MTSRAEAVVVGSGAEVADAVRAEGGGGNLCVGMHIVSRSEDEGVFGDHEEGGGTGEVGMRSRAENGGGFGALEEGGAYVEMYIQALA